MSASGFTRSGSAPPIRRRLGRAALAAGLGLLVAGPAAAQVEVRQLTAPDLFSYGAPGSDLPSDLWVGSSGQLYGAVVPELGVKPLSPAAAGLARHVLAAPASGPQDVGKDPQMAGARVLALLRLGDAAAAAAITDRTPGLPQRPALSQAAAEAALLAGNDDKACAIGDALAEGRSELYWLKLRAFCQARAGQGPAAQLTADLAVQQGKDTDFQRLIDALIKGKDGGAPDLDGGVDYALSRQVVRSWPESMATTALSPALAVAVARDPKAPPAARAIAAASAARLGVLVPEAYAAVPAPPDVRTADVPGPAGEAALVALAQSASDWGIKEQALIALLRRGKTGPELQALAQLAAPDIAKLVQARAVLKQPMLFAMAAAAAGDGATARAARSVVGQGGAAPAPVDLAVLDALIAADSDPPAAAAIQELLTQSPRADALARVRGASAIALLGALGAPTGPDARFAVAAADLGPSRIPPGSLLALDLAARAGRSGEVALYVLLMAAESGPTSLSVADRGALVRALWRAGLKRDARAFALEGLIALQARP